MVSKSGKYGSSTKAEQVAPDIDVKARTIIVTGGNEGLGLETVRVLASRGADVIIACRSIAKGETAVAKITADYPEAKIIVGELDLNSLQSVHNFVDWFLDRNVPLHVLICNAGIMALKTYETTSDGVEKQWGVNHLGHFHLTTLLLPKLRESAPSRVVMVSSGACGLARKKVFEEGRLPPMKEDYSPMGTYGDSKLSNVIFAKELDEREGEAGVHAYSLHPGVINTGLGRNNGLYNLLFYRLGALFNKSIPQGAATTIYCALESDNHGGYHTDAKPAKFPAMVTDTTRKMLWDVSEKAIAADKTDVAPSQ